MTAAGSLMTGDAYLESLRDGRQVYLNGERVKDVTRHPAFRNSALSVARLYDAMHDPATSGVLTGVDEATGIRTHKFFKPSRSAAELVEAREAIATWARMSYGFLGRTPEYKASFMAGLGVNADYYGQFAANATAWYDEFARKALYLNHVIINPPVDRKRAIHDMEDVFVRAVRETDAGVVVSGAKMLATGSAITNAGFVAPVGSAALAPGKAEAFALVFFVRMDNPGVKLVCRTPYAQHATSPFDAPLSSRFDENDSVLLLDEALIPWEDVLVYRDVKRATGFYATSGFPNLYNFQSGIRLSVKLELMAGLLARGTRANGTDEFRGVQAAVGEVITMRDMVWALTSAMAHDPEPGSGGTVVPRLEHASAMRMYNAQVWDRVHELFETTLGGAPLAVPSSARDLADPELRPLIDRFYRGADTSALDRIKLLKLVWDAIGTEFGGRHELYERNYSGNGEQVRLDALRWATGRGSLARYEALVQDCLDDYDLDGWRRGPWRDPAHTD
ncbi:4-hydroxyphenylacetate 3-hydroxylase family protein [Streptomyces telluris]|uniref:4-hydroxyphenylacetate 3-hydroxylase family protein n=1 Tax=Streptomyces telluris TaxID=2720021 RepID=A0A9X2LIA5_9ACTN|nr:4-hydroxyphenylacetate 3-hydroxylase family protein [Streptomyces telluris]MCQ8771683.1 4-hydroxyphenylacetate 3-hydroxylase family protein [Streptomyces telluris]NJP77696.1 Pyoverdin chromophore biosynthetic protein pvcC [Streptomyces telluris]